MASRLGWSMKVPTQLLINLLLFGSIVVLIVGFMKPPKLQIKSDTKGDLSGALISASPIFAELGNETTQKSIL
jgi:hypothetical protein